MTDPKVKPPASEPPATDEQPRPARPDRPAAPSPVRPSPAAPTQQTAPPTRVQRQSQSGSQPQAKVDLADQEPLSMVVVETPDAELEVRPETRIEVPVEVPTRPRPPITEAPPAPRIPGMYWALAAVALGLMFLTYRAIFEPLVTRVEDAVERRVLGDKIYEAPKSNPHTTRQKEPHFHF